MNKIIFFLLIIVFLFKTGNVFSDRNIFYVDNIIVESNNNQKKERLLNKAFQEGFKKLIKRILLKKDQKTVLQTSLEEVKKMVSTYQIQDNKDLSKANELTVNLFFDRERMNNFFYSKGISYADISKTKLVFFPVLVEDNNFYLFSNNYFFKNWNIDEKEKNNEFVDYILPVENLEDIQFIERNRGNLESIDPKKILSNYDIENYMFLVIKIFDEKIDIFLKGTFSDNNIVKNFHIYNPNSSDREVDFQSFIKTIKDEINEIWKSQNLIDNRIPSFLTITTDIKKQDDLLKIQKVLQDIELIENFYVLELTKNYARIRIKYLGKIDKIKSKFYEKGIKLQNLKNQWTVNLL